MKDIKSLYEAAKSSGLQCDITAYKEAVNNILESKPSDFISNLKYIITSDIGCTKLDTFIEKYGLSIASYQPIIECLEECIDKCESKHIDSSIYKYYLEKFELIKNKYQHCFDMFYYYSEGSNSFDISKYLESYYGTHKSGIQMNKCINIMIDNFGEAAIADGLITADRIDSKAVCQLLEYVSKNPDKILSQWICECCSNINTNYDGTNGNIKLSEKLLNIFESNRLDKYVEIMESMNQKYLRESLLLGNDNPDVFYTEEDISAIQDLISFKEYQIVCTESTKQREKLQKEIYSLYEFFNGFDEDLIQRDCVLNGVSESKSSNNIMENTFTEDISWRNTRNKKTGDAPSYISSNHNIGYGEDEKGLNDFKRKSVFNKDKDDENKSDEELDKDPEFNGNMSKEDRQTVNNSYYYYTYNNSLNKNQNSFNKNDNHSVDNSVDNSKSTDDHSSNSHNNNTDDHSKDKGNNRNNTGAYSEGFLDIFRNKNRRTPEIVTSKPEPKPVVVDKSKIVIVTDEIRNIIISKLTDLKKQFDVVISPILDKYINFGMYSFIDYNSNSYLKNEDNDDISTIISKRLDEMIRDSTEWLNANHINVQNALYLDGSEEFTITIRGTEWRDLIQDIIGGKYPGEYEKWKDKINFNNKIECSNLFWNEKLFGYDKSIDEICDEISSIIKTKFPLIKNWKYLSDGDGISYGGYIYLSELCPKIISKPTNESSDPTELNIFGDTKQTSFFEEGLYNNEFEVYEDFCEAIKCIINDVYMESSDNPRYKFAYKAAYDFNTGHALKITYSLNPITITNVGVAKHVRDEILDIVNRTSKVANEKNIFRALLTAANGLIKSKHNIEVRKTVLTEILNKYIDQVGYVDFQAKDCRIVSITDRATKEKLKGPVDIVGVYAAADLNENRSLALSPYVLKRMQDRVKRRGSNFKISTISVGDIQTTPTFMSTYWDRNCDKGLVNQNGNVILDDDMDRDNLSQIISSREIQGFDIDTKKSRFSDGLGDFVDPIRSIGDSKKNKMFKKLAYENSVKYIGNAEDFVIFINNNKKDLVKAGDISEEDLSQIDSLMDDINEKISQADKYLQQNDHENVYNSLNVPKTIEQQKNEFKNLINEIREKYQMQPKYESVGDADDNKPESDHPIRDMFQDIDRERVKSQQNMKRNVQNVQNVVKAAKKPLDRTKNWVTNMVNDWKDKDENAIKEELADPKTRSNVFTAIKTAIKAGSLLKAGLLLNPVFLFLSATRKIGKDKNKIRLRNEIIGELKTELDIIDEKIEDARRKGDDKAKYQLMRLRNEINKKLNRVSGPVSNKKWVKGGIV